MIKDDMENVKIRNNGEKIFFEMWRKWFLFDVLMVFCLLS